MPRTGRTKLTWHRRRPQDYRLRAQDYNRKKARIKTLRQRAADRNPDEFYFGMHSNKMAKDGTRMGDRGNKALSVDVVRLLKTQDAGYLRIMATKAKKEVDALEQQLHIAGDLHSDVQPRRGGRTDVGGAPATHRVFVDSRQEQRDFDPESWFGTDTDGLKRRYNRPRTGVEPEPASAPGTSSSSSTAMTSAQAATAAKAADAAPEGRPKRAPAPDPDPDQEASARSLSSWEKRLHGCRSRLAQLEKAEQELSLQKAKMAKTATVGGTDRRGKKWKVKARKR